MKRTLIALGLGAVAVAVLVLVAAESRPIPAAVHIAQNRTSVETTLVNEDFAALVSTLQSAWDDRQLPGDAAHTLANRIAAAPARLKNSVFQIPGNSAQRSRIENSLAGFENAVEAANGLATDLLADQTAYGESVAVLRDQGPQAVQRMRDLGLERSASDIFELVVGTLDFATNGAIDREYELKRLLVTLARDQRIDANMPRDLGELGTAVETILALRSSIEGRLEQLALTPVPGAAENVDTAVHDTYESAVARADRARWLLAAYALVLLGAVVFVGFRLKDSYKTIHAANTQLALLNESLEERVRERTQELEAALAELSESQVQLVQAEKMSSLGQLVAGISHEINTPLLYLANNIGLIREQLEPVQSFVRRSVAVYSLTADKFKQRVDLQKALAAGITELKDTTQREDLCAELEDALDLLGDCNDGLHDLTELAQSLKDFSRLDRAPVGNFNVNDGIEKTLLIANNAIKHKATVTKNYGEVPEILCSPSKINQVFLNLITNAAQAITGTGQITITTAMRGNDRVAITIADTGCGIAAENLDKIRDPFFTTKEVGTGTGLGLSIVDEIVRSHGGDLEIQSELGKGSVFTVLLPLEPPQSNGSSAHTEPLSDSEHAAPVETRLAAAG